MPTPTPMPKKKKTLGQMAREAYEKAMRAMTSPVVPAGTAPEEEQVERTARMSAKRNVEVPRPTPTPKRRY